MIENGLKKMMIIEKVMQLFLEFMSGLKVRNISVIIMNYYNNIY